MRHPIIPITDPIPGERQQVARHYGAHPYFTRRPANVVRAYIERFTKPGDVVLDPFGGSGVTAIEAMLLGRRAIHNDLNPLANFITSAIADTRLKSTAPLKDGFQRIEALCMDRVLSLEDLTDDSATASLKDLVLPTNKRLPRSSDVERFHELFSPRQLAALAIIKEAIDSEEREPVRQCLLLAWSATAAKLNRTFLSAQGRAESRGGSSIFSIYRYKVAKRAVELPPWETFLGRFLNVLKAKEEVLKMRDFANRTSGRLVDSEKNLRLMCNDALKLPRILGRNKVDYVFTDPPYGGHIAYLDLSELWNHWLGLDVPLEMRQAETIVGGELQLSQATYLKRLHGSIRASFDILKPDRWLTVVFQHWNAAYFEAILNAAHESGSEFKAAVTQDQDVIWSMHKKKNSKNVLAGEMLLTFYKPAGSRRARRNSLPDKGTVGTNFKEVLDDLLESEFLNLTSVSSEHLLNRLVVEAWNRGRLGVLELTRDAFAEHLKMKGWAYESKTHSWNRLKRSSGSGELFIPEESMGR